MKFDVDIQHLSQMLLLTFESKVKTAVLKFFHLAYSNSLAVV